MDKIWVKITSNIYSLCQNSAANFGDKALNIYRFMCADTIATCKTTGRKIIKARDHEITRSMRTKQALPSMGLV